MEKLNFHFTEDLQIPVMSNSFNKNSKIVGKEPLNQEFFIRIIEEGLGKQNYVISNYHEVAKHLGKFYSEEQRTPIKTDVSGLIIPICHGDINVISNMSWEIGSEYEKDLRKYLKPFNFRGKGKEKKYQEITNEFFSRTFDFLIFEAHIFLPGYRNMSNPLDMGEIPLEDRMNYVKYAFGDWINRNFRNK